MITTFAYMPLIDSVVTSYMCSIGSELHPDRDKLGSTLAAIKQTAGRC